MTADGSLLGTVVAFVLTLMVYCYLLRDIPFMHAIYRVAAYVFIGVALGYGAIMAWHSVFLPRLLLRLEGGQWWYLVPLALCLLLISRVKREWSGLGAVTIAFVFGVGAALAVGGALVGTLLPQVGATFVSLNPTAYRGDAAREGGTTLTYVLNALLIAVGTTSTLLYFYFTADGRAADGSRPSRGGAALSALGRARNQVVRLSKGFGLVFIMFTLGAIYATMATSYLSLLADRFRFLIDFVSSYVPAP